MIDPTQVTNRNRILPEGKGIVVIFYSDFHIDYPIYSVLNTKANKELYGTIKEKENNSGELKWERKHVPFNIDAKAFFADLQTIGAISTDQEKEFWDQAGNVNKMRYLYSITNLRMVV